MKVHTNYNNLTYLVNAQNMKYIFLCRKFDYFILRIQLICRFCSIIFCFAP